MKKRTGSYILAVLCFSINVFAQSISPDLSKKDNWLLINRSSEEINENGKRGIFLNASPGDGVMLLKDYEFSSGIIEADIKGKDAAGRSFVGIAFMYRKIVLTTRFISGHLIF